MEALHLLSADPQDQALYIARQAHQLIEHQLPTSTADVRQWQEDQQRVRYLAQQVINRLDSNSENSYRLFKGLGIPVTWPNFWKRLLIRRKQRRQALREELKSNCKRNLIVLFETIGSQTADYNKPVSQPYDKEIKSITRDSLNRSIKEFNAKMTQHGAELGLNYELFKYLS